MSVISFNILSRQKKDLEFGAALRLVRHTILFNPIKRFTKSGFFFLYNVHHNLALRENIGNVVVVGDENNRNVEKQKRDVGK